MAEKNQHIEDLQKFREVYVAERRREVRTALELREANGDGGLWGDKIKALQEIIEAIDAAIKDENSLRPRNYGVRTLGD